MKDNKNTTNGSMQFTQTNGRGNTIYRYFGRAVSEMEGLISSGTITPPLRKIRRVTGSYKRIPITIASPGVRIETTQRPATLPGPSQKDPEDSLERLVQDPEAAPTAAQLPCDPSQVVMHGTSYRQFESSNNYRQRITKKVAIRIEDSYADIKSESAADDVFTTNIGHTPQLSDIYNCAYDGIIPHDGIQGPSVVGKTPVDEQAVRESNQDPDTSQE